MTYCQASLEVGLEPAECILGSLYVQQLEHILHDQDGTGDSVGIWG